jgi:predicted  nucleic acid-binding Zn-ribbon protein
MNTKNKFEKIMVQKDGELINIQDLDQKDYVVV